ncbi:MAG: ACP S-malonyltransferase, partial [Flavobacteriaceae bacterium]|nr:ACP S-malonyltransferase [Flavobacteriaceae bacterium]
KLSNAGARRALILPVGGAFHSELMIDAKKELSLAIEQASFNEPICPIYQNVNAKAETSVEKIKENLISQLTSPVKWTQSVNEMIKSGTTSFIEIGPGKVLQGLIKKIDRNLDVSFPEL